MGTEYLDHASVGERRGELILPCDRDQLVGQRDDHQRWLVDLPDPFARIEPE